jgi:hypothetical protein
LHLRFDRGDLLFEVRYPTLGYQGRLTIRTVEPGQVALDALLELLQARLALRAP